MNMQMCLTLFHIKTRSCSVIQIKLITVFKARQTPALYAAEKQKIKSEFLDAEKLVSMEMISKISDIFCQTRPLVLKKSKLKTNKP